jgi:hypothetical protein
MLAALGLVCGALGIAVTVPLRAQYPATLTIPRGGELAGLKIMPGFEEETSEFERDIRRDFGVRDAYAVLLRDPAAPTEPVLFAAVTGFILNPGGELTKAMRRLTKGRGSRCSPPARSAATCAAVPSPISTASW